MCKTIHSFHRCGHLASPIPLFYHCHTHGELDEVEARKGAEEVQRHLLFDCAACRKEIGERGGKGGGGKLWKHGGGGIGCGRCVVM